MTDERIERVRGLLQGFMSEHIAHCGKGWECPTPFRQALDDLASLQQELERLRNRYTAVDFYNEMVEAQAEVARLRAALETIAAMEAEPVGPDGQTCIEVARAVLDQEVNDDG